MNTLGRRLGLAPNRSTCKHQTTRGDTGPGGDKNTRGAVDLVDRGAAELSNALGDAVHAVDVGLSELAAVGVEREPATELDGAVRDEVLGLAASAEAELLELHEDVRREVVVEH